MVLSRQLVSQRECIKTPFHFEWYTFLNKGRTIIDLGWGSGESGKAGKKIVPKGPISSKAISLARV